MAWKAEIKKLIEDDTLEVNVQATQIMACLAASHVSYEAEFGPDLFFCHPSNRGGIMLNKADMHTKGAKLMKVGAKLTKLTEAICFEMSKDPAKRQKQVEANERLAEASGNMIAPPTGHERFLTVATSNTVGFCRAVNATWSFL